MHNRIRLLKIGKGLRSRYITFCYMTNDVPYRYEHRVFGIAPKITIERNLTLSLSINFNKTSYYLSLGYGYI